MLLFPGDDPGSDERGMVDNGAHECNSNLNHPGNRQRDVAGRT
jgi:hypothetical protein